MWYLLLLIFPPPVAAMALTSECLSVLRRRIPEAAVSDPQLLDPSLFFPLTTAPSTELNDRAKGCSFKVYENKGGLLRE